MTGRKHRANRLFVYSLLMAAMGLWAADSQGAAKVRVSQESGPGVGDFNSHVLGFIEPYSTALSAAGYYGAGMSFSGPAPQLNREQSHLFLVNASNGLSLFIVHDAVGNWDGGHAEMLLELSGDSNGATITVRDDADDTYFGVSGSAMFTSRQNWPPCCTDGLVLTALNGNWSMMVSFTTEAIGLGCWTAFSSTGDTVGMELGANRRVRLDFVPDVSCDTGAPDDRCVNVPGLRGAPFPPAGLDQWATGASFKVKLLDGTERSITGLVDPNTVIGRSDPFNNGDPEDIFGAPVAGGGQAPYPNTSALGLEPCVLPTGFPRSSATGQEVHTQMLSLFLSNAGGDYVKAGQPYYSSVVGTPQERFYRNTFGEVQGLDHDFPADSFFNVFVEVYVAALGKTFYNKSPMVVRGEISQFPPDFNLPRSVYLHDPTFAAVPLIDENGIHAGYLLSAGHGAVSVSPPPQACETQTILSNTISFTVDGQGIGIAPSAVPNDVAVDQGISEQQSTVYASSGATAGNPPDVTNARVQDLIGAQGMFAPGDTITGISWGRDGSRTPAGAATQAAIVMSVGRNSVGDSCASVRLNSALGTPTGVSEQAGDLYITGGAPFGAYSGPFLPASAAANNSLLTDQTVLGLRPLLVGAGQDNIISLEMSRYGVSDRLYAVFTGPSFGCDPAVDCNNNGVGDGCDVSFGSSDDCNNNGIPDECELAGADCNGNGAPDACDISSGASADDNANAVPDECEDCNLNGVPDSTDIAMGTSQDTNANGIPDECDDCNTNGIPDADEIAETPSRDSNGNGILDECEDCNNNSIFDPLEISGNPSLDCNDNGLIDSCDVASGRSSDDNSNGIPDDCEDCNDNGVADSIDIAMATSDDTDMNGVPDECEDCNNNGIPDGTDIGGGLPDMNGNGIPDECEDCNNNGTIDADELMAGTSQDCNGNGLPDDCDIAGSSNDCDANGVPDECETDCNGNGFQDGCDIAGGSSLDLNADGVPDECQRHTATIYVYDDQGNPATRPFRLSNLDVFASAANLGLTDGDVIDALVLSDVTPGQSPAQPNGTMDPDFDEVLYSLAPGSPTLAARGWSAADVLYSRFNGSTQRYATAASLGLLGTDNLDALDVGPTVGTGDCNCNGDDDSCDIARGFSGDCNGNTVPDECELQGNDCNCNSIPDDCDIASGAQDCNNNGIPDTCEPDCNGNGVADACDIGVHTSDDCNNNAVPDECEGEVTMKLGLAGAASLCTRPNEPLTIRLSMSCLSAAVRGYQAFVEFDSSMINFVSGSYNTGGGFGRPILSPITANDGDIDLAAGIDDATGQMPTSTPDQLVTLQFMSGPTSGTTRISFRCHDPGTMLTNAAGEPISPVLFDSPLIYIDGTAPVISCPSNITVNNDAGQCSAMVSIADATATDVGGSGVTSIVGARSDNQALTAPYPVGTTTIAWTATDCSGNSSTCMQTVTVADNERPNVTCAANVSGIVAPTGTCQANVTVPGPTTSDNCGVDTVTNNYTNTSNADGIYPVGTTTVVWTVTDIHGNNRQCSQTVTVIDTQAPTVACPANVTDTSDPGQCAGAVTVPAPATADNCTVASVINNRNGTSNASGSYPVGTTTVMWTVTDASGNSVQCSHTVTVTDNEPPTITCPSNITQSNDAGQCQAMVTVPIPTTGDNCGVASFINTRNGTSNASGVYPIGTTSISWTVTDIHGNTGNCSQTVTVFDTEVPTITCPPDVMVNAEAGGATAFVSIPAPSTADNCGVQGVTNNRTGTGDASGTYPVGTTNVVWTVTDIHGNSAQCTQHVTVEGLNEMLATVELSPVVDAGPFTRCITFELFDCGGGTSQVVEQEMTFTNGLASNVPVLIPAGVYDCITARDRLHTLRRTDEAFHIEGSHYVADFTGNPSSGGDWLIGGNINDDEFIDILDFGIFVNRWAVVYGTGDSSCATASPHADISGDGQVTLGDFTFIQINFLKTHEANCCGLPGRAPAATGPSESITVQNLRSRGLGHLAAADLNGDGLVDASDIAAFAMGQRPAPVLQPGPGNLGQTRGDDRSSEAIQPSERP